MRVLFIDNLDSFTFNLVHCLEVGGATVEVLRNDGEDWPDLAVKMAECDAWAVGPGPGRPQDYPHLMRAIAQWIDQKPLLGICLGQQAIAQVCGWNIAHALKPMHGKPSVLEHNAQGLFEGLPSALTVGRYHSLVIAEPENDSEKGVMFEGRLTGEVLFDDTHRPDIALQIDARCGEEVMAVSAPEKGVWAVQFHPESVLTPQGQAMINRWLHLATLFQQQKTQ